MFSYKFLENRREFFCLCNDVSLVFIFFSTIQQCGKCLYNCKENDFFINIVIVKKIITVAGKINNHIITFIQGVSLKCAQ